MLINKLKKGDNLTEELVRFVQDKPSGVIVGLGALESLTVKTYDLTIKKYHEKFIDGPLEIGSFTAIVGKSVEGKMDIHPHIVVSDKEFNTYSGHVDKAVVGATFEFFFARSENEISRYFDKTIGLNLIK